MISENFTMIYGPSHEKTLILLHANNIYRPPNSTVQWNEHFEDCIKNVLQEEKEIYLLGDINRNLLDSQIKRVWNDYMG